MTRVVAAAVAVVAVACAGSTSSDDAGGEAVPSSAQPVEPLSVADDGTVEVAWDALTEAPYWGLDAGDDGELWYLHTNEPDGFLSVEAYTSGFGSAWSGELGTYPVDCTAAGTGICLHLVAPGAEPNLPSDFAATGLVTFVRLDPEGYEVVLQDVAFGNGLTIPGPVRLSG